MSTRDNGTSNENDTSTESSSDDVRRSSAPSSNRNLAPRHEGQWRGAHPRGSEGDTFPSRGFSFEERQGRPLRLDEQEVGAVNVRSADVDEPLPPGGDRGRSGEPRLAANRDEERSNRAPSRQNEPRVSRETLIRDHRGGADALPRAEARRGDVAENGADERIRADVHERLAALSGVDASEVEVTVRGGEVHLSGFVADRWQKHQIENEADRVAGVVEIENLIRLRRDAAPTRGVERSALPTPDAATTDGANAAPTRAPTVEPRTNVASDSAGVVEVPSSSGEVEVPSSFGIPVDEAAASHDRAPTARTAEPERRAGSTPEAREREGETPRTDRAASKRTNGRDARRDAPPPSRS